MPGDCGAGMHIPACHLKCHPSEELYWPSIDVPKLYRIPAVMLVIGFVTRNWLLDGMKDA
jgi:hypothetical protein